MAEAGAPASDKAAAGRPAVAIVADDLTGAMDAAGPFAGRGRETRAFWHVDPSTWEERGIPEVMSVSTASRHLTPDEAVVATRRAVAAVMRRDPRILFKKIDSTLRGNVAVEIAAALAASGRRHTILAPAVPAQGRALVGGELRLAGGPVEGPGHESATMRPADALRRDAPGLAVRTLAHAGELALTSDEERPVVHVVDCRSDADLEAIARTALPQAGDVLFVGAAGLAGALARLTCPEAIGEFRPARGAGPLLFVVGSLSAASRDQAEALRATMPDLEDVGATPGATDQGGPNADIILLQTDAGARGADPLDVAARLAATAKTLIAERAPRALVLTGGDTARAVLDRLGVTSLDILGETAPGVVAACCRLEGRPTTVVTKAGGFGPPDLFADLARRL